ncbi:cytochrome P450 [Cladochytrium replicatum]|nr:cytochrome P450 [Cladochytrium replicatum]
MITDPNYISMLMRKTETLLQPSKQMAIALSSVGVGNSIVTADVSLDERKIVRRLIERPLSATQVNDMRKNLVTIGLQLRDELLDGIEAAKVSEEGDSMAFEKNQMDFLRILKRKTLDSIMLLAYGLKPEEYGKMINHEDIELLTTRMVDRMLAPFPYWIYFKRKADREVDACVARVHAGAHHFLQKALLEPEKATTMMLKGFLDTLSGVNGEKVSYDVLIGNFVGNLVAGQDTTANSLFHIFHCLAEERQVQEKVQNEVDSVLKDLERIEDLDTLDYKESFKYIHAFVREINRLNPYAILTSHRAAQDIQLDSYHIPEGTELMLLNHIATLKSSGFEDKFVFRPERWFEIDNDEELRKRELATYMPFSGGPHICPGRHLAMAEMICFTVILCSEFDISYKPAPGFVNNLASSQLDRPLRVTKRTKATIR